MFGSIKAAKGEWARVQPA